MPALAILGLGVGTVTAAVTQSARLGTDASLPFAARNISTWQADGDKGIWVESLGGAWYYGAFLIPCLGLQFRDTVAFKFGPAGQLDHWSEIHVRHYPPCVFKSFVTSAGPPLIRKKPPA